jgi:hypothetical protein
MEAAVMNRILSEEPHGHGPQRLSHDTEPDRASLLSDEQRAALQVALDGVSFFFTGSAGAWTSSRWCLLSLSPLVNVVIGANVQHSRHGQVISTEGNDYSTAQKAQRRHFRDRLYRMCPSFLSLCSGRYAPQCQSRARPVY